MAISYTLPSDNNVIGNTGHTTDHNNIVDVLTGMGAVLNVLNTAYSGGADPTGAADSTAAIQAALNAVPAAGGVVYFPAGTYKTTSTLTIPSTPAGIMLRGAGRSATVISAAASFTTATPVIQAAASGSNYRYDVSITDLTLNTAASGLYGIQLDSTYFAVIERVNVQGVWARNIFLNGTGSFFGAYTSIRDCNLGPVPGGAGSSGVGIYSNDHEHWVVEDCTINWFDVSGGIGIQIRNSDCRVTGCRLDECDTAIDLFFCAQAIIAENFFDRGLTTFVKMQGCTGAQIVNNSFNVFSGAGNQYIIVPTSDGGRAGNLIAGNRVLNGAGWHGFVNEAGGSSTDPDVYENNNLETVTTVNRTSSSIWRENIGLNPVGKVTSPPAVPGSTTAATNTTGTDCMVYVTTGGGVTISAITVGGQAAGAQSQAASSTSAGIRVPALQTIALTYAGGTPTWTWFGD